MSKDRRKVDLNINPMHLVVAILNYVAASLPHLQEEKLDPGDITLDGITPPLTVSAATFWRQFGNRKRFKHANLDITVDIPSTPIVEMSFQLVLERSKAKGLGAYREFLQMFGFSLDDDEHAGALDDLFKTFKQSDPELQKQGIALLRMQFAFEIVRCSLLGETIKWYDSIIPGMTGNERNVIVEDRKRCVRMQGRFQSFVQLWGPVFQIYYNPNDPVQPQSYIPEVLRPWFEMSN